MKPTHQVTYSILITFKKLISTISIRSRYKLAIYISKALYTFITIRKTVARNNLIRAFPQWTTNKIERTLKKSYDFFCFNLVQFIGFPNTWEKIEYSISGKEVLQRYIEDGNGIIMITGHFGAWEILGKWLADYVDLFTGIAFKQKNLGAHRFFIEQRELSGTKHIFKREPLRKMYEVLEQNGILGIVSDQDAGKKGVFIQFFGTPASTAKGAALFHINTKSPLLVAICIKTGFKKYRIKFIPVVIKEKKIESITQAYTSIIEKYIKKYPEQYFWFHRRWKSKQK